MRFFDTNILVYAASNQDPRKRAIALDLLRHALEVNHDGVISLQILQEFTNVMLKRSLATDEQIAEKVPCDGRADRGLLFVFLPPRQERGDV